MDYYLHIWSWKFALIWIRIEDWHARKTLIKHLDRIASEVKRWELIRKYTRYENSRRVVEKHLEELWVVSMEIEWYLNPGNPEGFYKP